MLVAVTDTARSWKSCVLYRTYACRAPGWLLHAWGPSAVKGTTNGVINVPGDFCIVRGPLTVRQKLLPQDHRGEENLSPDSPNSLFTFHHTTRWMQQYS